jgi:HNH endonuclease
MELPLTAARTETFWRNVKQGDRKDCWPYLRPSRTQGGYGAGFYGNIFTTAHRIAYCLANGPFPKALHVVHRCDNRLCCNPLHLFLGTPGANQHDMIAKGRARFPGPPKGEKNGNAKLADADIEGIKGLHAAGWSQRRIAANFGVSKSQIGNIIRGESR